MRHVLGYGAIAFTTALLGAGLTVVTPAAAQDRPPAVQQRHELMESNGAAAFRTVVPYIRENKGMPADVEKAADTIAANAKKLAGLFPAGTSSAELPGKTLAKPEIWQDKAKFDGFVQALGVRAEALSAAAKTGEKEKIQQAFNELNRDACTACHTAFRAPPPPAAPR